MQKLLYLLFFQIHENDPYTKMFSTEYVVLIIDLEFPLEIIHVDKS